ncbi:MAG: DUF1566 domain-containing protein [Alkalimonas sp.]|nr:DUF1566 domain-containing protein [Alkalimonas sp.]
MKISLCWWLLLPMGVLAQQQCYEDITRSTEPEQFIPLAQGQLLHQATGLIWQRCLYGQQWHESEGNCSGEPVRLSWSEALLMSVSAGQAGQTEWRLPDVKEAMSVVERQCVDPAIDITLFPAANSENLWTSTTSAGQAAEAWAIAMYSGKNNLKMKEQQLYVRLVRFSDE